MFKLVPKIGYHSLANTYKDYNMLSRYYRLKKYDKENKKLTINLKHWGIVINDYIYLAKCKNLFRFKNEDWVYYPKINLLYKNIIDNTIEKYYKQLKKEMKSKDYKFKNSNVYNEKHVKLLKKGGNKYFK